MFTTTAINTCKKNSWIWSESRGGNFFLYVSY